MSLSAPQLALLRSEKQLSILGLAILQPKTIFACQLNSYLGEAGTDMVIEIDYTDVTAGAYGDVLPGMACFVGTSAGAHDVGICRIRAAADATTLYVGETSEIDFSIDPLYLTVVDAFDLTPKHLLVINEVPYMDYDIAYDDQQENYNPVCILGGHVVLDVEAYPVSVDFPDVINSWVFDDTIASYLTEADEGVVTDETTTDPTLTISSYPTNGYIRVALTVTSTTGGKSTTRYGYVFVFDSDHRPITDFTLESCQGNRDSGGWSATVQLSDADDISLLRYRGLAVLFSKDYYDGTPGVVGLHTDRENILMQGWIFQNTDRNDPEFSPKRFEIQNAAFWLKRMTTFPTGVELNATASWTGIPGLTIDKGLFHLLYWRTTAPNVMDIILTDDTRYTASCESASGTIWAQLVEFAEKQIMARVGVDAFNRLFVYIPYNLTPAADRASNSTLVMALATTDYQKTMELQWVAPRVCQIFLSGAAVSSGGTGSPLFSLSPGHTPGLIGEPDVLDNMLLSSQSQSNSLAGLVYSYRNNPYPDIPLDLTANNRAFDIAPNLYATIALDEYSGGILPKVIEYTHEPTEDGGGRLAVEIGFEAVTTEGLSTNGDIPIGNGEFITPGFGAYPSLPGYDLDVPDIPPLDFPGLGDPQVDTPCEDYINNMFALSWSRTTLDATDSTKLSAIAYFPCKIRAAGSFAPTYIKINGIWGGDSKTHYHVYAIDSDKNRILTATVTHNANGNTATFAPVSNTQVNGFEITVDEASAIGYTPGAVVASGIVLATNGSGVNLAVVDGQTYCIESTGGPWHHGSVPPWYDAIVYTFWMAGVWVAPQLGLGYTSYNGFSYATPPGCFDTEAVDAYHGRAYFHASGSSCNFLCADNLFSDNVGQLGYLLRLAGDDSERNIQLYQSTLYNVCAI